MSRLIELTIMKHIKYKNFRSELVVALTKLLLKLIVLLRIVKPFQATPFLDITNNWRPLDEMLKKLTEICNYTNKYLLNFNGNATTLISFNLLNLAWSLPDGRILRLF